MLQKSGMEFHNFGMLWPHCVLPFCELIRVVVRILSTNSCLVSSDSLHFNPAAPLLLKNKFTTFTHRKLLYKIYIQCSMHLFYEVQLDNAQRRWKIWKSVGRGEGGHSNVSWVMEFLKCWVLKSKVFGQKSTVVKWNWCILWIDKRRAYKS